MKIVPKPARYVAGLATRNQGGEAILELRETASYAKLEEDGMAIRGEQSGGKRARHVVVIAGHSFRA